MYPPSMMTGPGGQGQPGGAPPHVQQQMMQAGRQTSNGRPLTPTGSETVGSHNGPPSGGQYPMMAPHGYYDQNGSMMMNSQAARGMNPAAMRMMAPMMMNPNQAGPGNNMRMMGGSGQNGQQVNSGQLFNSNNNSNGYANNGNSYSNANSSGLANGNGMNFGHMPPQHNGQGYGSSGLGPIGGGIGSGFGNGSPRRDSFDGHRRDSLGSSGMFSSNLDGGQFSRHLGKNGQYYPMGSGIPASPGPIGMLPSQSPPPSNGLGLGQGRMSAAPGAEAKYMGRNGGSVGGGRFGGSTNGGEFTNRLLHRR